MAETFELEIATPERQLVREEVTEAQIPGKDGFLGILPGHSPLIGLLGIGVLSYVIGGRKRSLSVHGGFLEVLPDHVRVLADLAERADEIDAERARRALQRAQVNAINPSLGVEPAEALAAMLRAQARLAAVEQK